MKRFENVEGVKIRIGSETYFTYKLYQAKYCPVVAKNIIFPPMNLYMNIYDGGKNSPPPRRKDVAPFRSKSLTINVKPLPEGIRPSHYDFFKMVGQYALEDSLEAKDICVGDHVVYQIKIKGDGLTFPITPLNFASENVRANLLSIKGLDNDTVAGHDYVNERSYQYSLTFDKEGIYNFGNDVQFKFFDPKSKKMAFISSKKSITVKACEVKSNVVPKVLYKTYPNLILVDISRSMQMEDYQPNRLGALVEGLVGFLSRQKKCSIGVMTFSSISSPFVTSKGDSCYSNELIRSIDISKDAPGTAIGDAVWNAKQSLSTLGGSKIVLIGDGENTAGTCSISLAASIAKKYGLKIYTIGIGTEGPVPMGTDVHGKPQIFERSYVDKDLKYLALQTGGRFFWAKDSKDVTRILREIFP